MGAEVRTLAEATAKGMTVSEAAKMLGLHRTSVHDLILKGRLRVIYFEREGIGPVGRKWILRADVEKVAAQRAARRAAAGG